NHQPQRLHANARTIGNNEIAQTEQRFIFLPHRDVEERVRSDHEVDAVALAVKVVAKVAHRIPRIVELVAREVLTSFGKRRHKVRMLGASERHHRKSMWEWREMLLQLVRRATCRDEMHLVKVKPAIRCSGDRKMSAVNRVEGTAKQSDAT